MPVPSKIKIAREADYHTDTIGTCADGRQFMGFVVASLPLELYANSPDWQRHKRWHAVMHTFAGNGSHLGTEVWTAGTTADGEQRVIALAEERLSKMLAGLGVIEFGDIEVCLFRVLVDDREFGLVDASEPEDDHECIQLLPNDLVFFDPWDGSYDT